MSQTTKRALEASLKSLLLKKPLDKITISDIAEDCGISRMTFYYHFKDIYDLVEWVCAEDAARALDGKKPATRGRKDFSTFLTRFLKTSRLFSMFTAPPTVSRSKPIYIKSFTP